MRGELAPGTTVAFLLGHWDEMARRGLEADLVAYMGDSAAGPEEEGC